MNPGTFSLHLCSLVVISDSIYIKEALITYYVTRLGYNTTLLKYDRVVSQIHKGRENIVNHSNLHLKLIKF